MFRPNRAHQKAILIFGRNSVDQQIFAALLGSDFRGSGLAPEFVAKRFRRVNIVEADEMGDQRGGGHIESRIASGDPLNTGGDQRLALEEQ